MIAMVNHFEIPLFLKRLPRSEVDERIDSARRHLELERHRALILELLEVVRVDREGMA